MLFSGCSSGGGDDATPAANAGFVQEYTASATAGEILKYTLDTRNLTYTYQIIFSAYGLTNATGSGTLIRNADGSYSPSNAPGTRVYALQNGLLVGTVNLRLNGSPHIVPIFGMSRPISSLAALAGRYNFVGIQCAAQTFGVYTGCDSSLGTVTLDTEGNYTACPAANIAHGLDGCTNLSTGVLGVLREGVWQAIRSGSVNVNYFLAFAAPNGQNVLLLDLNDLGGYGYGFIVMSSQTEYVQSLVDGTWYYQSNAGTSGSLQVSGNTITNSGGVTSRVSFDFPWEGLASTSQGVAILAGTGAYAFISPNFPEFLELGIKK
jgi:hypothetical protein